MTEIEKYAFMVDILGLSFFLYGTYVDSLEIMAGSLVFFFISALARHRAKMKSWRRLLVHINKWADVTFGAGNGNTYGKAKHIEKEAVELMDAVRDGDKEKIRKEIADIMILAIHAAHGEQIDLYEAIAEKFEIVKKRRWQAPDADGVIQHVEE